MTPTVTFFRGFVAHIDARLLHTTADQCVSICIWMEGGGSLVCLKREVCWDRDAEAMSTSPHTQGISSGLKTKVFSHIPASKKNLSSTLSSRAFKCLHKADSMSTVMNRPQLGKTTSHLGFNYEKTLLLASSHSCMHV